MRLCARRNMAVLGCLIALIASIATAEDRVAPAAPQPDDQDMSLRNPQLVVTVNRQDGSYTLTSPDGRTILQSVFAAQLNQRWMKSSEYPKHEISKSSFEDRLGQAQQITIRSTGLPQSPDLICVLRQYERFPFTEIAVEVQNRTNKPVTVQAFRSVESVGNQLLDLGASERADRVMSDAEFSPPILALGNVTEGVHVGLASQLIYNTESKQSVFFGALTEERFVTVVRLTTQGGASDPRISALTIESAGTSDRDVLKSINGSYVERLPAAEQYDIHLTVAPGASLASERLMVAAGNNYYAQLDTYGAAVRQLHRARLGATTMMGWLADVIYGEGIPEGLALTNAKWLAEYLKRFGFNYVHVEAENFIPTTETTSSDGSLVHHGMWDFAREISELGLRKAGWVNILDVPESSFIYKEHKDWLVKNAQGAPLLLLRNTRLGGKMHFGFLDTTHPGAQDYLRRMFRTIVRQWGWRQIDLDGLVDWSLEGYRYRPNTTAVEADRIALQIIRETVGDDVVLQLNAGFLELSSVGLVDTALIADPSHLYSSTREAGYRVAEHYYMDHNFFVNDPGTICVESELTSTAPEENGRPEPVPLEHAKMSIVLSALWPGARFALGDDLPNLGTEPDRLALVTNSDLLQMVKLGHSARPLDLMPFEQEDEQPSIFFVRQDARQSMVAVFNWTKHTRSHNLPLAQLGLAKQHKYELSNVLDQNHRITLDNDSIHVDEQAAESVVLVKIIDETIPPAAPTIKTEAADRAKVLEDVRFSAQSSEDGVPALEYKWDFGDGVTAEGPLQSHAYTKRGKYAVHLRVGGVDGVAAEKNFQIEVEGMMSIVPPEVGDSYAY